MSVTQYFDNHLPVKFARPSALEAVASTEINGGVGLVVYRYKCVYLDSHQVFVVQIDEPGLPLQKAGSFFFANEVDLRRFFCHLNLLDVYYRHVAEHAEPNNTVLLD